MGQQINKGDQHELRIARLLFHEGNFVRRGININMHFLEDFTVTDVDVLAMRFSPDLRITRTIGEAKATEAKSAPKATDRLLWGGGLSALLRADAHFVATVKPASGRVRRLATELGAELVDAADVAHRERLRKIEDQTPWGPFEPELLLLQRGIYDCLKSDSDLKRVYWFVRSDFWFLDAVPGLKRALGACRLLGERFGTGLPAQLQDAVLWLAEQAVVTAVFALARVAGESYRHPPDVARPRLLEQLAEGASDYETQVRLSKTVDRYILAVLKDAGLDPARAVDALGALNPVPPSYAEPLLEVVERLAAEPLVTAELPRLLDWRLAERRLGKALGPLPTSGSEIARGDGDRLLRMIGVFLVGQTRLAQATLEGLWRPAGVELTVSSGICEPEEDDEAEENVESEPSLAAPEGLGTSRAPGGARDGRGGSRSDRVPRGKGRAKEEAETLFRDTEGKAGAE